MSDRSSIGEPNGVGATTNSVLLSARGLTKRFGDLIANNAIDLDIYGGEVHAILGENGAGKSTLMKMLYGFYRPDHGEIWLDARPVRIESPQDGRRLGIGMVFQNFTLIPALTVLENIALFLPDLGLVLRRSEIRRRIEEVSQRYGLHVPLHVPVGDLSIGEQQKVEIIKILLGGARVLIFDEPTSVLAPQEVQGLFQVFGKLRSDHYAILFITHKLPEVMSVANRITVLRHGNVIGAVERAAATEAGLVAMMLGTVPPPPARRTGDAASETYHPLLEFRHISAANRQGEPVLHDVSLQVFPGEIVGVAGVSGNGQEELGEVALGLSTITGGALYVDNSDATRWQVAEFLAAGYRCIPEDPLRMAAVPGMTVAENMILGAQHTYAKYGGLIMDWSQAHANADRLLNTTFVTTPPRLIVPVETLSGGNLQRVIIAREVGRQPKLLIAYYPARGLDISNAEAARSLLLRQRMDGIGILLISEDLDELFALSDRLLVMHRGAVAGCFRPEETTSHQVGLLMTGGSESNDGV